MLSDHGKTRPDSDRLSKAELKEACSGTFVQTKIKLRSRWSAPLKYKVLMTFQLSEEDRKVVAKGLVKAITPKEAKALREPISLGWSSWSYRDISLMKDFECGVLQFKGLAVCLFYKRQCAEIEPVATDPVPIGALESEDDIWARLDLFSKSPRELHASVREDLIESNIQIEELKHGIAVRDAMIIDLERRLQLKGKEQVKDLAHRLTPSTSTTHKEKMKCQEDKARSPLQRKRSG